MFKHLSLLMFALGLVASASFAADVEYSTTGTMDTPATLGGDRGGWGTEFITRWDNTTGTDVTIEEFGWPCGGWWSQFWYVWIADTLPADPYSLQYYGSFVATSEDDTEWPPSIYTYVDVSAESIVIPADASMYFGYGNPGMGGQISFNGVETFSWLDDAWDMDGDYGRTAVMQFKGTFGIAAIYDETPRSAALLGNQPNPFNPTTTITFSLPREMAVGLDVYSLRGRHVKRVLHGHRGAGPHQVIWNGTDHHGNSVPSGSYLVRMVTDDSVESCKMILAR